MEQHEEMQKMSMHVQIYCLKGLTSSLKKPVSEEFYNEKLVPD